MSKQVRRTRTRPITLPASADYPFRTFGPLLPPEHWAALVSMHRLSGREIQILELVCRGWSDQALCGHLKMARPTLRTHLRSAYRKIGIRKRIDLVLALVHRFGVTPSDIPNRASQ